MINKQLILKKRPVGMPTKDTWELEANPVGELNDGEVLIKNHYVSLDPAMRGWMNDARSYIPPVGIGEVMRAGTVSEVVESKHGKYKVGDIPSPSNVLAQSPNSNTCSYGVKNTSKSP